MLSLSTNHSCLLFVNHLFKGLSEAAGLENWDGYVNAAKRRLLAQLPVRQWSSPARRSQAHQLGWSSLRFSIGPVNLLPSNMIIMFSCIVTCHMSLFLFTTISWVKNVLKARYPVWSSCFNVNQLNASFACTAQLAQLRSCILSRHSKLQWDLAPLVPAMSPHVGILPREVTVTLDGFPQVLSAGIVVQRARWMRMGWLGWIRRRAPAKYVQRSGFVLGHDPKPQSTHRIRISVEVQSFKVASSEKTRMKLECRNMRLWSMLRWPSKGITIGNTFAKKKGWVGPVRPSDGRGGAVHLGLDTLDGLDVAKVESVEPSHAYADWILHWCSCGNAWLPVSADSWSLWICITLSLCHFGPACTHIHSNILASQCIHVYAVCIHIPCTPSKLSRLNTYHPGAGKVPVGFQNQAQGLHKPDLRCAEKSQHHNIASTSENYQHKGLMQNSGKWSSNGQKRN